MDTIPALPAVRSLVAQGVRSTFHDQNRDAIKAMRIATGAASHPLFELLFDPQTAGGLVVAVAEERLLGLVNALVEAGEHAAVIGTVTESVVAVR